MSEYEIVQGNEFSQSVSMNGIAKTTASAQGPSPEKKPRVVNQGGRATVSIRFSQPGRHQITITETKVTTITVNVTKAKSRLETSVWSVLAGKREPLDPPAKSLSGQQMGGGSPNGAVQMAP